jgi:ABC-type glycerol-3-phosphate transport system substrate-binding protein
MEYLRNDLLSDLRPYVDPARDGFYPGVSASFTFDGKTLAAGFIMDPYLLFYNPALFDAAGVKSPKAYYEEGAWNWENFARAAREMTDPSRDQWGFAYFDNEYAHFMAMNGVRTYFPGNIDPKAGKYDIVSGFEDTKAQAALAFIRDGYGLDPDGSLNRQRYNRGNDEYFIDKFRQGKLAMTMARGIPFGDLSGGNVEPDFVPLPVGPAAEKERGGVAGIGGMMDGFCIPKTAGNPAGAVEFMKMSAKAYLKRQEADLVRGIGKDRAKRYLDAASKSVYTPLFGEVNFFGPVNFENIHWSLVNWLRMRNDGGLNVWSMTADELITKGSQLRGDYFRPSLKQYIEELNPHWF